MFITNRLTTEHSLHRQSEFITSLTFCATVLRFAHSCGTFVIHKTKASPDDDTREQSDHETKIRFRVYPADRSLPLTSAKLPTQT